jgi:hypothetical protein
MDKKICWNIVNSLLMFAAVILGALTTGNINLESLLVAFIAGGLVAVNQFKDYWQTEKDEYIPKKIGAFI